jgi:hypothetical protein
MNGEFGEDLQSVVAQTIVNVSQNVPAILKGLLIAIRGVIQQNKV